MAFSKNRSLTVAARIGLVAACIGLVLPLAIPALAQPADTSPIRIGEYGSLTGSEATFGTSTHNAILLAIEEVNAAGGVHGRRVEVRVYDERGNIQEVGTVVQRLINQDKVVAVLGEVASSRSIAGGRICQQAGVPMITPSSTNPQVTQIGDMIFRVCYTDPFQGLVAARFASAHLKARKAATLVDQAQAYSKGLNDFFKKAFLKLGGTITTEQVYTGGDQDFSAQLTTIRETQPDVIFIPGYYTDVGNIALQARRLGITCPLLGGDGWDSAQLAKIAGPAIEGCFFVNHYAPDQPSEVVRAFVEKFKAKYGEVPDGLAAPAYDATRILCDAIGRAKSLSGKDLARAIAETKDFRGVTGVITFDRHLNARKSAVVVAMRGGQPRFVTQVEPESE